MNFEKVLSNYRKTAYSERDKGARFETLMKHYLLTSPLHKRDVKEVWLWNEFPYRSQFGGKDVGIDLVSVSENGEYTAIQCKCYQEDSRIDKAEVDTFLSTSGKFFINDEDERIFFSHRLWISTTNNWSYTAEETLKNQSPAVNRINLSDLENAPVDWEELDKGIYGEKARVGKKTLRPHQQRILEKTKEYYKNHDRGRLIMACGTGKTYTSLKIAEQLTDNKGLVLFLVPSIALLGQTLREWSAEAEVDINPVCICSDPTASKKVETDENDGCSVVDLAIPASTDINNIKQQLDYIRLNKKQGMTAVFSTYQSIDVISKVQKTLNEQEAGSCIFDLIICDEAHRTTGVILNGGQTETAFTKVHDNSNILAKKRLYMTATPRLYNDNVKEKAKDNNVILCSMDDETVYGEEIDRLGFGEAVSQGLLSDYKVLVLTLTENDIPQALQNLADSPDYEITTDDATKLVGCINALSKRIVTEITAEGVKNSLIETDSGFMHKAVAFCSNIKASNAISKIFNTHGETYYESLSYDERKKVVSVSASHVDGSMGAAERDKKLSWLKSAPADGNECRILTNVRCLSEGVDVPSLDAVMFLSAKNSQVDVVQSVGRVMRKAEGKQYGYIIIPVVIPPDITPEEALDNNDRFKAVWTVLNALRAHDDRFNAIVNKIELNNNKTDKILVGGTPPKENDDKAGISGEKERQKLNSTLAKQLSIQFEKLQDAVYARMVKKVGNRRYWEQWAKDVADIAQSHVRHIKKLLETNESSRSAFDKFLKGLQKQLNPSVTQEDAIEMLSQHLITRPVFEALFENYRFVKNNPVSVAMQGILDILDKNAVDKSQEETLGRFYASVKERAEGINNSEGRQKIIIELYDKFFKTALPMTVEKLGIVYTPVEVVDFILQSVSDVLKKEFNRTLSDENIHILDPFTGTGTFITRLLQGGYIDGKDLERKYNSEIHANEIVLLAYYIASINIENVYHDLADVKEDEYKSFEGICLTDTFQMSEYDDKLQLSDIFPQNSERVEKQKKCPLTVIVGNPPYSIGQRSANDNAQNQKYEKLDNKIAYTYAKYSKATNKNSLYDSYIKAFRWASDRLSKTGGVIGFVSNGGWLDSLAMDGFRQCLEEEFSSIYVYNLRGNARTSGEQRQKEKGNVFGEGTRTPISITILVNNPDAKKDKAVIYYHDIGDYLSQREKLDIIQKTGSVLSSEFNPVILKPDKYNDWLNQRNEIFSTFIPMEPDKKFNLKSHSFFNLNTLGATTGRDSWCYNFSEATLKHNINETINFYNKQREDYVIEKAKNSNIKVEDFIDTNPAKISWSRGLKRDMELNKKKLIKESSLYMSVYRPFQKQYLCFDKEINEYLYKLPELFPTNKHKNTCICLSGTGSNKDFSTFITEYMPDSNVISACQCFPLYWYEEKGTSDIQQSFLDSQNNNDDKYIRHDGITDYIHNLAKEKYGGEVAKEDIFYYVYGILHSREYRTKFASDLKKMLPRIPLTDNTEDFYTFSNAGRDLAKLHLNYEDQAPLSSVKVTGDDKGIFTVNKMRFKSKEDKSEIIYNDYIRITNIPKEAYEYAVNGKSAVEWVMERYQVTINKDSLIKNNPNNWAEEHNKPRYILDLLLSVISLSVATVKIVNSLPKLTFDEEKETAEAK